MNLDGTPDAEDIAFYTTYGRWRPLTITALTELMRGFPHPWWLVGGHAIEAFTGVSRPHADIDVSFFSDSIAALLAESRWQNPNDLPLAAASNNNSRGYM